MRSESLGDVALELVGNGLAGEGDIVPDLRVADSVSRCQTFRGLETDVIESLKASMAWPYFLLRGQAMLS